MPEEHALTGVVMPLGLLCSDPDTTLTWSGGLDLQALTGSAIMPMSHAD